MSEHEHHEQSFIEKYIFTTDHKMIGKQFLITGILWAFIGGLFSVIFRLQLGFPDMDLSFLKPLLGKWILSLLMLMGRLELFTVCLIFTPYFWKRI